MHKNSNCQTTRALPRDSRFYGSALG
jgi:hypothetical protein